MSKRGAWQRCRGKATLGDLSEAAQGFGSVLRISLLQDASRKEVWHRAVQWFAVLEEAWGTWDFCSGYPQASKKDWSRTASLRKPEKENLLRVIIPLRIYPVW